MPPFKLNIPPHRPDDSSPRGVEGAAGERDKFDIVPSKSPTARQESDADKTQRQAQSIAALKQSPLGAVSASGLPSSKHSAMEASYDDENMDGSASAMDDINEADVAVDQVKQGVASKKSSQHAESKKAASRVNQSKPASRLSRVSPDDEE